MRLLLTTLLLCLGLAAQAGSDPAFTPDQLARFAKADKSVQAVRVRYLDVLAEDEKEGRDLKWTQAAMQIDMGKAITAAGLSFDDYNRIAHAMAADEALRHQIEKME